MERFAHCQFQSPALDGTMQFRAHAVVLADDGRPSLVQFTSWGAGCRWTVPLPMAPQHPLCAFVCVGCPRVRGHRTPRGPRTGMWVWPI